MTAFFVTFLAAAAIGDVGFPNNSVFLKTVLSGPYEDQLSFYLCRVNHPDEHGKDCLPLSSCTYLDRQISEGAARIADSEGRTDLQMMTNASFQSRLELKAFVSRLLELLPALDVGRNCEVATMPQVETFLSR